MSGFEDLLRDTLGERAEHSGLPPTPLERVVGSAHHLRRRRRLATGVAATALLAAVVVPVGIGFVGAGPDAGPKDTVGAMPLIGYAEDGVYHPVSGPDVDLPHDRVGSVTEIGDGRLLVTGVADSGAVPLAEISADGAVEESCTAGPPVQSPDSLVTAWTSGPCGDVRSTLYTAGPAGDFGAVVLGADQRLLSVTDTAQQVLVATPSEGLGRGLISSEIAVVSPIQVPGLDAYEALSATGLELAAIRTDTSGPGYSVIDVDGDDDSGLGADHSARRLWSVDGRLGAFSPDGRYVIAYSPRPDENPAILDARDGTALVSIDTSELPGAPAVGAIGWEDDAQLLVSLVDDDGQSIARVGLDGVPQELDGPGRLPADAEVVFQTVP